MIMSESMDMRVPMSVGMIPVMMFPSWRFPRCWLSSIHTSNGLKCPSANRTFSMSPTMARERNMMMIPMTV